MTPRRFTLQWFAQKATMMLITVAFVIVFIGAQMLIGPVS